MGNMLPGMLIVLVCLAGYLFAFRLFGRNKIRSALILLMGCGLLLRIFTASDPFLHKWDERYHALVAKNLMQHPLKPTLYDEPLLDYDYMNWGGSHVWLHKQPLPLWTMAASMSLFGTSEFALRLPSILLTTLGIWIIFVIGRILFNRRTGFIAAFLYSIHGLIIELTAGRVATDHVDIFFLFFIQLAVLFAILFAGNRNIWMNILCGISMGLAVLSKWLPALIVIPVWLLMVLDSRRFTLREILLYLTLLCIVAVAVFLPWQLYIHRNFPQEARWASHFNRLHIFTGLEGHGKPFLYHFGQVRILYGEIVYLPLLWLFWKSFKDWMNFRRMALTVWILVPFIFFSFAQTKMQAYTLFTAPAIFIATALFWHYLYVYRRRFRFRWIPWLILILLLALPVRYSLERIKPFDSREKEIARAGELKNMDVDDGRSVIFNVDDPIATMFYTDFIAYEKIPDLKTVQRIAAEGYTVYINDRGMIGDSIRALPEVTFLKLKHN